jgi:site-specific recombinase XerC
MAQLTAGGNFPTGISAPRLPESTSPSQVLGVVLKEIKQAGLADQSVQRMAEIVARFTIYVEKGHGLRSVTEIAGDHVEGFVFAPSRSGSRRGRPRPSVATMHLRRSALRLYFRTVRQLGLCTGDPTLDLVLPARSSRHMRPLTDDELVLCRSYSVSSLTETRRPAAWALAEATARTSEIPHIRVRDLDLEEDKVWLWGSTKAEPRWGRLTEWGCRQLARRIDRVKSKKPDALLVYGGAHDDKVAQISSCIAITDVLRITGLAKEPDVRPHSVVAWAGRRVLSETSHIEAVAKALGARSLDRAASLIGWEWRDKAELGADS